MDFKEIFWLILLLSLIISIGFVSASDVNDTTTDIVAQPSEIDLTDINEEDNLEISQENQIVSSQENSRVIYVGQNKTSDGGNGSYENPYQTLKLACDNVNGEDTVEINLFNGTYYLNSELKFNTNNLLIQGINGKAIIENPDDGIKVSLGFPDRTTPHNYTFSNIIFKDCKNIWDGYTVMDGTGYGIFNNCTLQGMNSVMNNVFTASYPGYLKFIQCSFIDISSNFITGFKNDDVLELEYCSIQNSFSSNLFVNWQKGYNILFDSVFFGQNSLPDYIQVKEIAGVSGYKYSGFDIPITRYAIFTAHENYLGNNTYEIIGNLMWNDSTTDGIEKLNPINLKLSSNTGEIQSNVLLENGSFRVIYKSNSKDNAISIDLGSQRYILNFINYIEVAVNPIFYGENQNINVKLVNKTNSTVNITVNNITYHIKVNDSNSFNFTVPDELLAGIYQVNVEFADNITHNYGFNSTNWTISKVDKELYILTPADARVDDEEINVTAILESDASGEITVFANNKNITYNVNGGEVSIDVSSIVTGGDNNITICYSGNKKYTNQSRQEILVVNRIVPNMNITIPTNLTTADDINLEVKLPNNASGNITVTINNKNLTVPVKSSNTIINVSDMIVGGNNKISIVYSGDAWWERQVKRDTVFVSKISPNMNVTSQNRIKIIENLTISITLPKDATGNITVKIGEKIFKTNVAGNVTEIEVSGFLVGNNAVSVIYSGDDKYETNSTELIIAVEKTDIDNVIVNVDVTKGTTIPVFSIVLPADATGNLTVDINGKHYTKELKNGSATLTISELNPGKYDATITYNGDGKYNPITTTKTFSIPKPVLTAKNFEMLYTSGSKYTVLVTLDGKAVVGKTVTFTINGKKVTAITDKSGYASVKINLPPKSKAYTLTASYLGVKVTNKVTVKSIISAKNVNVKKSAKKLKIKVTLKKVDNKYLKGKTISLKFNGKTIKAKTNKKGVATFTIKKNVLKKLKVGKKYTYKVTYLKDSTSKKITVKK